MKNINDKIDRYSDHNIFISIDKDATTKAVKGQLNKFPIVVKDNINVKGFNTTAGTPALIGYSPKEDASIIAKLRAEGAIIVGKTNLHELAFGITSNNFHFGAVKNPKNPKLFAGGSSGGTAAAIAAGIVDIGLGTDTGGSCRIPAALCGVIGFRPTQGRYPTDGIVPLSHSRDTPGLLSSKMKLIQLFDRIITTDSTEVSLPKRIRIGVSRHYFFDNLSKEVATATEDALKKLAANERIELVEVDMIGIEKLLTLSIALVLHETDSDLRSFLTSYKTGVSFEELAAQVASPDVKGLFDSGAIAPQDSYKAALAERQALIKLINQYFVENKIHALICPTTVTEAKAIEGSIENISVDGKSLPTFPTLIQNTNPGSYAGLPSISLPATQTTTSLPIGIQLEALANQDLLLLEIAHFIQNEIF